MPLINLGLKQIKRNALLKGCILLCVAPLLRAQVELKPNDIKESVKFQIKNLGLTVEGSFGGLSGKIIWNEVHPENSSIDVSINTATVDTGIALRDKHLRKEDYFDAVNFPVIRFNSTKISTTNDNGVCQIEGKLSIKKTTKTISFLFKVDRKHENPIFTGRFILNRKDYGVGNNSLSLAENVVILLNVHCVKINNN